MNKIVLYCLISAVIGGVCGYVLPINIMAGYNKIFAVATLAGVETLFNGLALIIKRRFLTKIFILNFLLSVMIAVIFVIVGDNLGLDLYYVVLLALGFKILQDLDVIKNYIFNK